METQTPLPENLWLLALASKCHHLSSLKVPWILLLLGLAWLAMAIVFWAYSGGPAWGCYLFRKGLRTSIIPGPRGFPFIGSMNLMANLAHHKIAAAAESFKATRLMAFSIGETRVIVTCNPDVAKEILNSSVFADRPIKESAYSLMFNRAIGFAPYGVYWRTLRRIAATHFFCPKQIVESRTQRFDIASQMIAVLRNDEVVRVRQLIKSASLHNMMCSVFGRNYRLDASEKNDEMDELRSLVDEGYDLLGTLNWSDHLPWIADLDPQKIRSRCSNLVPKVNRFVERIVTERRQTEKSSSTKDFVDVLLYLQGTDHQLSNSDMIAVLWEMIFRGTDTVAVLIEWVLARMVLHPDVQSKVHEELDKVVGRSRAVHESDISSMVYLTAVIKEVLRLHPPGPLLSWARLAISDTTVDGYHVPAGTTAMVNMWAISRDPKAWADPNEFRPERFVSRNGEHEFSVFGSDLRLAPFGSGRRTCPGKALGLTTVSFWVASLLHEFEWSACEGDPVDLSEFLRLSCEMKYPLVAKLHPRS